MAQFILPLICKKCADNFIPSLVEALKAEGKRVADFGPIADGQDDKLGNSVQLTEAVSLIADGKKNDLVAMMAARAFEAGKDADAVVLRPIFDAAVLRCAYELNIALAHAVQADVLPSVCGKHYPTAEAFAEGARDTMKLFAAEKLAVHCIVSGANDEQVKAAEALGLEVVNPHKMNVKSEMFRSVSSAMTPVRFLNMLHDKARADRRTIVMPEGNVDRIIRAASALSAQKLAAIVLLGDAAEIQAKAAEIGAVLDDDVKIVNPADSSDLDDYSNTLYELRKAKGMTPEKAHELMLDKTFFGTMMVYKGAADGMVSGATTSTANTIRPALQFIKTKPGIKTVSGVFLMSMKDCVYVYGDCAVIPNPTPDQLADVAIASAATAKSFGLDPKIAMLSYSTGVSGSGPDVDAVREAAEKAKAAAPELAIEGPIQYDAAVAPEVAKTKAPNSPVAGQANVFVFPSLNAGNIGYKAVQRSSGAIAIGPLLQGLKKPVNDLSRGATVDDIINTVVVTAIQAQSN